MVKSSYMSIFLPKPEVSKSKYKKVFCTLGTRRAFDCGGKICDGISSAEHSVHCRSNAGSEVASSFISEVEVFKIMY